MTRRLINRAAYGRDLLRAGINPTWSIANRRRVAAGTPRVLARRPLLPQWWGWSPRRINALAQGIGAQRYLEVGVFEGRTIENIAVAQRVGVDPAPAFNVTRLPPGLSFHAVESDTYFASITPDVTFDLAFLDGLHTFEQTWVDLLNALAHLPHGAILIDDTVPIDRFSAMPSRTAYDDYARSAGLTFRVWMGDVWKVVICINRHLPELNVRTIVGRGNRQTLVWRRSPDAVLSSVSPEQLRTIAALDYQEIMGQGLPAEFQPAREHEAIQACLETLQRAT